MSCKHKGLHPGYNIYKCKQFGEYYAKTKDNNNISDYILVSRGDGVRGYDRCRREVLRGGD